MMNHLIADLHIHTCLSACAHNHMTPGKIVEKSLEKGTQIIAICDHNSAENAGAAMQIGRRAGLCVLPGLEICSREEVHILAIFKRLEQALDMQTYIHDHLPDAKGIRIFGNQFIISEDDEIIGEDFRFLQGPVLLTLSEIIEKTHLIGGLSILSHVDRPLFGFIHQLGFIPHDLPADGIEISYRIPLKQAREKLPGVEHFTCITSSDAHHLDDIGRARTLFEIESPEWDEIYLALQGKESRKVHAE